LIGSLIRFETIHNLYRCADSGTGEYNATKHNQRYRDEDPCNNSRSNVCSTGDRMGVEKQIAKIVAGGLVLALIATAGAAGAYVVTTSGHYAVTDGVMHEIGLGEEPKEGDINITGMPVDEFAHLVYNMSIDYIQG